MVPEEVLEELKRLNDNLEKLHDDATTFRPVIADIRELRKKVGNVGVAARQLATLNQILLQTKKKAGYSGLIQSIISGLLDMERKATHGR